MMRPYPNSEEMMVLLREWQEAHDMMDEVETDMQHVLGIGPDSPISDAYWRTFDKYSHVLGRLLGDSKKPESWLEWYWLENKMGIKGHVAGYDGESRPVQTLDDLANLLFQARVKDPEYVCVWSEDLDHGWWQPSCGANPFVITEGTPEENRLTFCHHCARPIVSKPWGEEQ